LTFILIECILYITIREKGKNMKLKKIGNNVTEIEVNGKSVMFSYETPVAGYDDQGSFRTDEKFSVTTSKQINKYLGGKDQGRVVPQAWIEGLVA
tara:strand:- start:885 stop:1169 length:285 start_codon:yes stop_codon:yes gene_type:complete